MCVEERACRATCAKDVDHPGDGTSSVRGRQVGELGANHG
jgi:hypothetical protein